MGWKTELCPKCMANYIVYPNVHGFFDGRSHAVPLPAYNFEVLHCCFVATIILMVINWRWCPQMFFKSFTKHSR